MQLLLKNINSPHLFKKGDTKFLYVLHVKVYPH